MTEGLPPPPGMSGPGWVKTYAPPEPVGDIAAYLRANGTRYTREALDQRLLAAGHPPDEIAAAWATIEAEDAATGHRDRRRQTAAIIAGAYALTWLLVVVLTILPKEAANYSSPGLLAAILAVSLFVPGIIAVAIALATRWLRRATVGRVVAFAFVPMLILFALAGTCVSFMQSY